MKKDLKLSQIVEPLNKALKDNFSKDGKTRTYSAQGREDKEGLADKSFCKVSDLKSISESETKTFVDVDSAKSIVKDLLKEKWPEIDFTIEKDRGSSYSLTTYKLDAKAVGLGKEYQKAIEARTYVTTFQIKQKQTFFGEYGVFFSRYGHKEKTKMAYEISFEQEWYDKPIIEALKERVEATYNRMNEKEAEKKGKEEKFLNALEKYGITLEQFEELTLLRA